MKERVNKETKKSTSSGVEPIVVDMSGVRLGDNPVRGDGTPCDLVDLLGSESLGESEIVPVTETDKEKTVKK